MSRLVLRLRLQPSIPSGESPGDAPIIGGDTRSRTLVMDSSGSARLLKVPINEPVRGTPWNHQIACALTVIKSILMASRRKNPRAYWRLAAPTNKAVQRLREVTGWRDPRDARTVHAWIGRKAELQDDPPYGLVVDEAGFLDLEQMAELLDAARNIRRLVLVGDPDQLPSIGFGAVLRDLKSSGKVPHVELTQVRRTEDGRGLVEAAQVILAGHVPGEAAGVRLVAPEQDGALVDAAFREYMRLVGESGGRLVDVQALAPTRELVGRLNTLIQTQYNGRGTKVPCAPHLRVGDRVVCTETLYGTGLVNGLQGVVTAATADGLSLRLEGAESALSVRGRGKLGIVHGGELLGSPARGRPSRLVSPRSFPLFRSSLLADYTLIGTRPRPTRAKRTLVLVAARRHIEHAVGNVQRRKTQLADYIVQGVSG
ncbi:ATP-dependent DNA helicase [Myxococcus faecalis]|uniref:ATP-dependent DNA helicase n=1 Tax=Myxococcus faecalis TaxID=3115646 RepID=UPI003CF59164